MNCPRFGSPVDDELCTLAGANSTVRSKVQLTALPGVSIAALGLGVWVRREPTMLKRLPGPGAAQPRPSVALSRVMPAPLVASAGVAKDPTAIPSMASPMLSDSVSSRSEAGRSGGFSCASESRCANRCAAHLCRARQAASAWAMTRNAHFTADITFRNPLIARCTMQHG